MSQKPDDSLENDSFEDLSDEALDELTDDNAEDFDTSELEDENWDDSEQEHPQKKAKKKGGLFNLILIGGGVIAVAGFVYFKLMAGPTAVNTPPSSIQAPAPAAPIVAQVEPPATPPDAAAVPSPAPVADVPVQPAAPEPLTPMPEFPVAPASATVPPQPDMNASAVPMQEVPAMPAPVAGPGDVPVAPAQPKFADNNTIPSVATPADAAPPTSVPSPERSQQVDATAPAVPVTDPQQLKALEDRLSELSARLDAQANVSDSLQALNQSISDLAQRVQKLETTPPATAPKIAQRSSAKPDTDQPVPVKPAKPKVVLPKWTLRAVSSGVAYVSSPGSSELKTVQVGDRLPGLGTIQSIEQSNGSWRVIGSQGEISQ